MKAPVAHPIAWMAAAAVILGSAMAWAEDLSDTASLLELSLEELMNIEITSSAALTKTKPRLVPAAVATITKEDIQASGARSLYELLDIYVPNFLWLRHHWEADVIGLRGIISDRNDKALLLVNGRAVNHRTHFGVLSELDQLMLADIHHIEVVRGPGSALYGPGAVSMVINIVTLDGQAFDGTEIHGRAGLVEDLACVEYRHGQRFKDDSGGLFLYAGIGDYDGADKYHSLQIYPFTFPTQSSSRWNPSYTGPPPGTIPGEGTVAGEPLVNTDVPNDGASSRGLAPVKLHARIRSRGWDIWARYTRGGKEFSWFTSGIARVRWGSGENTWYDSANRRSYPVVPNFYGYQQFTAFVGRQQELSDRLGVDYGFTYSMLDFERFCQRNVWDASREDHYLGRVLVKWQPHGRHKVVFGAETFHLELGLTSPGWPDMPATSSQLDPMPRWSTNLYSFLAEHQWTVNDRWTLFLGARLDDHTYTEWLFSPRVGLVHSPTDRDTVKLLWSRSLRANFEENMKRQAMSSADQTSDPEVLESVEVRYERQQGPHLDLAASVFVHYNLDAIGWDQSLLMSTLAGTQREYGLELEAYYHTDRTRIGISHGYTKLYDFDLPPDRMTSIPVPPTQGITAMPYGYGDDLTNWASHITKITVRHKLDDQWTADASLRIYWGFPGMKDMDQYYPYGGQMGAETRNYPPYTSWPIIEEGWERAYRGSYFLNLGLQYKPSEVLTVGMYAYNVLGIFEPDLNKRNYVQACGGGGTFRTHAPALGLWAVYRCR